MDFKLITKQDLLNIEHIAKVEEFGNPVSAFRVTTERGYYIHLTNWDEVDEEMATMYKTCTFVYVENDISTVKIYAEADLPADARICGGDVKPPLEKI